MSTLIVFVVGFALAGAFFFWLRRLGRRMQAQVAASQTTITADTDDGDEIAENVGFAAEMVEKLARRRPDRQADDWGSDGGGDGG